MGSSPIFRAINFENRLIGKANVILSVHTPAVMDKNLNTDLTENTDLAFSLIFYLVNGCWISIRIFVDSRVLGHSLFPN